MRISEIVSVMKKIKLYYDRNKILNVYKPFLQTLSQILQQNQRNVTLEDTKNALYKAFRKFDYQTLSYTEKQILITYDATKLIGEFAVSHIETVLRDSNFDPAKVYNDIQSHNKECTNFYKRAVDTINMLEVLTEKQDLAVSKDKGIIQLHFTNKADFNDFTSFERWIDSWDKIFRNAAEIYDIRPEEIKISLIEKSSPLLIEVGTIIGVINLIGSATLLILKNIDKYLEIKMKVKELRSLPLDDFTAADKLEEQAELYKENNINEIATQIAQELKEELKKDDYQAKITILLNQLVNFVDKGGQVETYFPDSEDDMSTEEDDQEDKKQITGDTVSREIFSEIRKLQYRTDELRYLEEPSDTN